jgi:hypothetical protein
MMVTLEKEESIKAWSIWSPDFKQNFVLFYEWLFDILWIFINCLLYWVTKQRYKKNAVPFNDIFNNVLLPDVVILNIVTYFYKNNVSAIISLSMALQPFGHRFLFQFLNPIHSSPWTGDQPVAGPLPTHRTTQTQINAFVFDSNAWSQRSNYRRRLMP